MFTGLVEEIGHVREIRQSNGGRELTIEARTVMEDLKLGDSIAVQGVCLTVVARGEDWFRVIAVEETLQKTTLGDCVIGTPVNLERALLPTTRMGGHIVQGHVDTVGTIVDLHELESSWQLWIECPLQMMRYVVPVGSIAIDGISLTVARVEEKRFMIAIIPHTWTHTTIQYRRPGDRVNLEFDILAKYVERLLQWR
ncbi:MAG: riboflavin synthase [Bacteroidota bacterium]|nr:riboflavin synthase [Candidatus Kapabacteria bacterium]MCS7301990.1 riboflavin synthase [Candidatus Kapabacteria bacterium]MCX7936554.1 riboflavin synthase [Chlorobiota bacterium]MDW8074747.1 riboflavin synthase [Bacteroidota bacterium]MDW8271386.1 riboflavin synthase [Bacteroidota bacterium]